MRRKFCLLILLVILAMATPLAAVADDVSFSSTGGTFSGTSAGYVLTDATLTQISGLEGGTFSGSNLGTISFTTGIQGSISNAGDGGPIAPGGSFSITSNGSNGLPPGVLFNGTFPDGGTWGFVLQPDGTPHYTLTADVTGQDADGNTAAGTMTFTIDTGIVFQGTTSASGTDTVEVTTVPEPEEWSFIGFGLLGMVGAVRQKYLSQRKEPASRRSPTL